MDGFLNTMKDIGIFMMIAQTIINFMPAGSGGIWVKYAKPIVGLMILLKICTMILGGTEQLQEKMELVEAKFEIEWENYMERAKSEFVIMESGKKEE